MEQKAKRGQILSKEEINKALKTLNRGSFLDGEILFADASYRGADKPKRLILPSKHSVLQFLEALELSRGDRVLHIGTGFGFTTLALSLLVKEVVTLERLEHRLEYARGKLEAGGHQNVTFVKGGYEKVRGLPGVFDAVLLETSDGELAPELFSKLKVGGMLVYGLAVGKNSHQIIRFRRQPEGRVKREALEITHLVPPLEEILVDLGVTTEARIEQLRHLSESQKVDMRQALLQGSGLDEVELYRALALQRGLRLGRTEELLRRLDPTVLEKIPRRYMRHNQIIPIELNAGAFVVASPNPETDRELLSGAMKCERVELVLIPPTDYRRLWRAIELEQYGGYEETEETGLDLSDLEYSDLEGPEDREADRRRAQIFDVILLDAVGERASDIHLEIYGPRVRVRFRIDGDCVDIERYRISPVELRGIINVIKIGSHLDIAERRLPQGGRMERKVANRLFDLRVQTQPTLHGEAVIIRLLPRDNRLITIPELGFPPKLARAYQRLLDSPSGMVLVVGPTGSGKSTTLYGGLQVLADDARRKVITVEDPIEYTIDNVQQTQVKPQIGFSFANAMRAFVREDPDVILVGEIRDGETALEAIRASQTGHLVLSTLHSNDAVDAIQRLFDLGMHANSISSELIGVIAQRLAKRICGNCREESTPDPEIAVEVFPGGIPEGFRCYRGRGCSRCDQRGTKGRVATIEFMKVNSTIRRAISNEVAVDDLREKCLEAGLVTMRNTALDLVQEGVITFDELRRILPEERMAPESADS